MAGKKVADEFEFSIATVPPTARQRRLAVALIIVLFIGFSVTAPFAATQLARIDSFVPAVEAINIVTDLVTAGLLFNKFPIIGLRALLLLASGYLFSALTIIPHVLSYPGVLTVSGGLFGSGLQTTPWLYTFWHLGFCVAVLVYASVKDGKHEYVAPSSRPRAVLWSIALVISLVCALTWVAVAGEKSLPRLVLDNVHFSPLANYLTIATLLTSLIALVVLKLRQKSILDLWLGVAMVATVAEQAVVSLFIASRFSVGFYSSRMFSVVVSTIVLIALLSETINLYARLSRVNKILQRAHETKLTDVEAAIATIAHEIRQPLTAISAKSSAARRFLAREPADIERVGGILDDIGSASLRINEIIESVAALFRRASPDRQSTDVNDLVIESLQVLENELADCSITVDTQLTSKLPPIMGHKGQLQEVILNLVQNSIDAMRTVTAKPRMLHVRTEPHGRDAIAISVEDTGPGIEEKRLSSVFDAFVTTKTKRVGLGLAISQKIVERHNGQITAISGVEGGARFEIMLPIKADPQAILAS
ncbi:MAG: MASE4 domain-containing protein [Xanthobacteraceae bacterium]